jgi:hypothetical protein
VARRGDVGLPDPPRHETGEPVGHAVVVPEAHPSDPRGEFADTSVSVKDG